MKALKLFVAAAALLGSIAASAQTSCDAVEGLTVAAPQPSFSDISFPSPGTLIGCVGFFGVNQFGPGNDDTVFDAVNKWLEPKTGTMLSDRKDIASTVAANLGGAGGDQISFGQTLYGETLIGIHWGAYNSSSAGDQSVTAFYLFDAKNGLDYITLNTIGGYSNTFLYVTGPIPEPETYALMLAGLGAVGFMARRRKAAAAAPKAA